MSKNSKKKETPKRGRNWVFVLYEDSLPDGQPAAVLEENKIPYFLIWHDKDTDPNGEIKKKHAHLLLMFDGNKTFEQMMDVADALGCPAPQRVENLRSMARYLCHTDNPDKFQYTEADIIAGYGADYHKIANLIDDKYAAIREMIAFVNENDIRYYSDLFDYAAGNNDRWFKALCDKCREDVYRYIYSRAIKIRDEQREKGWTNLI